jgi:hypothetical protein
MIVAALHVDIVFPPVIVPPLLPAWRETTPTTPARYSEELPNTPPNSYVYLPLGMLAGTLCM